MKKINLNYRPSDLGNVYPKRTSGRASFVNKIRIFLFFYIFIVYFYGNCKTF